MRVSELPAAPSRLVDSMGRLTGAATSFQERVKTLFIGI